MSTDVVDSINEFSNSSDSDIWQSYYNLLYFQRLSYNPWVGSVIGSILVGLSGIFPLLVIPIDGGASITKGGEFNCIFYFFIFLNFKNGF